MGVKGLYTYMRCHRTPLYTTTLPENPKLRIGIDAMSLLYKYKADWPSMLPMLEELVGQGHRLLFVFDGKAPVEKAEEVKERREARTAASTQAGAIRDYLAGSEARDISVKERKILEFSVARLEHQGWHMTRDIRHDVQARLTELDIPFVKGIEEADAVLTDLAGAGKLDVVISTDMDFLLSGVPRLWIPTSTLSFEEIVLAEFLEKASLTQDQLLDAGILCGVEPLRGQAHVEIGRAFGLLGYYHSIEAAMASPHVKEPLLDYLRAAGPAELERVRAHFRPKTPWEARIRPDHLEMARSFLEAL